MIFPLLKNFNETIQAESFTHKFLSSTIVEWAARPSMPVLSLPRLALSSHKQSNATNRKIKILYSSISIL